MGRLLDNQHGISPRQPYQAAFTALVATVGVDDLDFPFFAGDFFALAGAGRVFDVLAFDCVFLAPVFGF
jgi:hypothetical protein